MRSFGAPLTVGPAARRWFFLAFAGWCALALTGCLASPDPGAEAEHHRPAHKPAEYPAAVARLRELHEEILSGAVPRPSDQIEVHQELSDVVRWLPELAADSDLGKDAWDKIHATTQRMDAMLTPVRAAPPTERADAYRKQSVDLAACLGELTMLAADFRAAEGGTAAAIDHGHGA